MSRSSPAPLLAGLAVALGVVLAAVLVLLDDGPAAGGGTDGAPLAPSAGSELAVGEVDGWEGGAPRPVVAEAAGAGGAAPTGGPRSRLSGSTRRLAGRLLRLADGSPLVGAELSHPTSDPEQRIDPGRDTLATTDTDGVFVVEALPVELHELDVTLHLPPLPDEPSRRNTRTLTVDVTPLLSVEQQALELDTGWTVEGRLRAASGAPLPDASVVAVADTRHWEAAWRSGRETRNAQHTPDVLAWEPGRVFVPEMGETAWIQAGARADGAGRFVLRDVMPTDDSERLALFGRAPLHRGQAHRYLALPSTGRLLSGVVVELDPAAAISGRVSAAGGLAVPGAAVTLVARAHPASLADPQPFRQVRADAEGRYELGPLPEGAWVLSVQARGRPLGTAVLVDVTTRLGSATALDVVLEPEARLAGSVVDSEGRAIGGAEVTVSTRALVRTPARSGPLEDVLRVGRAHAVPGRTPVGRTELELPVGTRVVGGGGSWACDGLPGGELFVRARLPSRPGWRPVEQSFTLRPGDALTDVRLELGGGPALFGRVVGEDGSALTDARVAVVAGEDVAAFDASDFVPVDEQGAFDLRGLDPGVHQLFAEAPGRQALRLTVEPSGQELLVTLEPGWLLEGQVLDAVSGEPVPRFETRLEDERNWVVNGWSRLDGRFRFDRLGDRPYTLSVTASGYRKAVLGDVRPGFGEPVRLTLELSPGG